MFWQPKLLLRHARLLAVVLFLVLAWAAVEALGLRQRLNLMFLHDQLLMYPVSGLLAFVGLFVLGNLIHLPGLMFLGAAVLVMGQVFGGLATYIAAVASCCVTFWLIRGIGADALRRVDQAWLNAALSHLDAHPVRTMAVARVLFQTLPTLNYALALSGVGFRPYLLATLIGLPLPIALYCLFFGVVAKSLGIPWA